MSLEKIDTIIDALRMNLPVETGQTGMDSQKEWEEAPTWHYTWSDKLVAEAVRLILDAYLMFSLAIIRMLPRRARMR